MSVLRKRATVGLVFWTFSGAVLLVFFFGGGGAESFGANSTRVAVASMAYGVALLVQVFLMWKFRSPVRGSHVVKDEWDEQVEQKANGVALVVVLLFIYLTGIILWEVYRETLLLPAGWIWFVAIFSIVLASATHAFVTLVVDTRRESNA